MSTQPNLNPWRGDTWQPAAAPASPTTEQASADQATAPHPGGHAAASGYTGQATATQQPVSQLASRPSRPRARLAGLVSVAVLAGALGGGGAGYAAATYFGSSTNSATQTQVVQADASNPNWTTVAVSAAKAVVAIKVVGADGNESLGSGVLVDAQGHIVTNNHVVSGSGAQATIIVVLEDSSYTAQVVGTDPSTDLAVIKLDKPPAGLTVMAYADSSALAVGDPVMAIGNPLGLDDTVTTGIVSALNRPVTTQAVSNNTVARGSGSDLVVTAAIQTNAAINPGNSGGALVNSAGQLVGITSSIASLSQSSSSQSGNIGIGFAIAADQVKYVADQLIAKGYADHPQIGVSARDLSGTGQLGAEVTQITSGSPAAAAGLLAGDVITAVNGNPVSSTESLVALVRAGQVGQPIQLAVLRNGSSQTIAVTPTAASR